ncbi:uncharacterized protein ASCRUDRAFT_11500 [Ascoidea rubescens DSM 1968]|uniref:Zn(2)-C6 fungal-type domain-containing protein n=1 Tax=Ascoidea rubescens DSM 1968 TaxID=1344418 RepID=A0A1D2VRA1_9ASCO|nr:hypothetical protein ASCRUDRAFT_11500 [Ascoidea rubescens DSM 1968]ODV64143.1 hypothetical protein ASCRUDRAFT_11500 [Ascoidea rubescens DSM 1968]
MKGKFVSKINSFSTPSLINLISLLPISSLIEKNGSTTEVVRKNPKYKNTVPTPPKHTVGDNNRNIKKFENESDLSISSKGTPIGCGCGNRPFKVIEPKGKRSHPPLNLKRKKNIVSREFNGCWMCRTRKVKCDLTKPTCTRCDKAGFVCTGYQIKLNWFKPLTKNSFKRNKNNHILENIGLDNRLDLNRTGGNLDFKLNDSNLQNQYCQRSFIKPFKWSEIDIKYNNLLYIDNLLQNLENETILDCNNMSINGPFSKFSFSRVDHSIGKSNTNDIAIKNKSTKEINNVTNDYSRNNNDNRIITENNHDPKENVFSINFTSNPENNLLLLSNPSFKIITSDSTISKADFNEHFNRVDNFRYWVHPSLKLNVDISFSLLKIGNNNNNNNYNFNKYDFLEILFDQKYSHQLNDLIIDLNCLDLLFDVNFKANRICFKDLFTKLMDYFKDNVMHLLMNFSLININAWLINFYPFVLKVIESFSHVDNLNKLIFITNNIQNDIHLFNNDRNFLIKQVILFQLISLSSFHLFSNGYKASGYTGHQELLKLSISVKNLVTVKLNNISDYIALNDDGSKIKNTVIEEISLNDKIIFLFCFLIQFNLDNQFDSNSNFEKYFSICERIIVSIREDTIGEKKYGDASSSDKFENIEKIIEYYLINDLSDFNDNDDFNAFDVINLRILSEDEKYNNELNFNYYYLIIYLKIFKNIYGSTYIVDRSSFQVSKIGKFEDILNKNYNKVKLDYEYFNRNPSLQKQRKIKIFTSIKVIKDDGEEMEEVEEMEKMEKVEEVEAVEKSDNSDYHYDEFSQPSFQIRFNCESGNINDNDSDNDNKVDREGDGKEVIRVSKFNDKEDKEDKDDKEDKNKREKIKGNNIEQDYDELFFVRKGFKTFVINLPLIEKYINDDDSINVMMSDYGEENKDKESKVERRKKDNFIDKIEKLNLNDLVFPIPLSLINLINKISKLCSHNNFFNEKKIYSRNFPKIKSDFEDRLINWKNDWKLSYYDEKDNKLKFYSVYHELIYHNVMSFYFSILIYYYKMIKEYSSVMLKGYVVESINHMKQMYKNMERIEKDNGSQRVIYFKPFFIQLFYTSCEAWSIEMQDECERLWDKHSKYDGGMFNNNYWRAKQIIYEVWKIRNCSNQDTTWVEILKKWNFKLLLI